MSPASKSQQKAVAKYMKTNYDELKIRIPKGKRDKIKNAADAQGESLNGYVSKAVDERMERDNAVSAFTVADTDRAEGEK